MKTTKEIQDKLSEKFKNLVTMKINLKEFRQLLMKYCRLSK